MKTKLEFYKAVEAWRQLYYTNLLSEKESDNIKKRINTRFKIK